MDLSCLSFVEAWARAHLGVVLLLDYRVRRQLSFQECLFSAGAEQRRRGECELPYSTGYFHGKQTLPSDRRNRLEKSTIPES